MKAPLLVAKVGPAFTTRRAAVGWAVGVAKAASAAPNVRAAVAPRAAHLFEVRGALGSSAVVGTPDITWKAAGPFTGGAGAASMKDAGVKFAMINHPERRSFSLEMANLALQVDTAVEHGMTPVVFVGPGRGETLTKDLIRTQIKNILGGVNREALGRQGLLLCYYPGNIDKGEMDSVAEIQKAFQMIESVMASEFGNIGNYRIMYGNGVREETYTVARRIERLTARFGGFLVEEDGIAGFPSFLARWSADLEGEVERELEGVLAARQAQIETIPPIVPPAKVTRVAVIGLGEVGNDFIGGLQAEDNIEVVFADNHTTSIANAARKIYCDAFLQHGLVPGCVRVEGEYIVVAKPGQREHRIRYVNSGGTPAEVIANMRRLGISVDVVYYTVGGFMDERANMEGFVREGEGVAKHVVVSSNTDAADLTIVAGWNHHKFSPELHKIIALSSCGGNAGMVTLAVLAENLGAMAIRGVGVIMVHSKTNTMRGYHGGAAAKVELIEGSCALTTSGFEKVVAAPGFFEGAAGGVAAISSRVATLLTSIVYLQVDLQSQDGAPITDEMLRNFYLIANGHPRFSGSVAALRREQVNALLFHIRDRAMASILVDEIRVTPVIDPKTGQTLYQALIPAIYGNVPSFGRQAIKVVQAIGCAHYGRQEGSSHG